MSIKERHKTFEFSGNVETTPIMGFEFHENFSPSESLEGMQARMEDRIKKVRKMKKNNIFNNPFIISEN